MIFLSYFLVFVLQVLFTAFKVFEIKYAYENKLKPILITGAILSVLTVLSTYLSVDLLFKGDWFVIIIYVAGGLLATTPYVLFLDADVTFTYRHAIKEAFDEIATGKYQMVATTPVYKGEFDIRASIMFGLNKYVTWFLSKTKPFAIGGFTMVNRQVFNKLGGYDEKATQSEDWLLSKQIKPNKFKLIPDLITQDNRRFKRYGYFSMVKLLYTNWRNRNNTEHFYKDQGYWK